MTGKDKIYLPKRRVGCGLCASVIAYVILIVIVCGHNVMFAFQFCNDLVIVVVIVYRHFQWLTRAGLS